MLREKMTRLEVEAITRGNGNTFRMALGRVTQAINECKGIMDNPRK
jgi:hypothetical protein